MIKDKISYLIDLCLEVQRGRDGNIESRTSEANSKWDYAVKGPTVFFDFYGHTAELDIEICKKGWAYHAEYDEEFQFYLDKEIDNEEFERCKTLLENLIEKQKEKEK